MAGIVCRRHRGRVCVCLTCSRTVGEEQASFVKLHDPETMAWGVRSRADGLAIDAAGRLYFATASGIQVVIGMVSRHDSSAGRSAERGLRRDRTGTRSI